MKRYNPKELEPKWQRIWDETGVYTADLKTDKPKYIAMSMFNYPSGAGIHIGHAMNYTISDVKARFKRQQGFESYHPVGWDAFGLPAENYAIKAGVSPQESMATIIPGYHKQYKAMGWSNDWEKEIATHLPEYYKWTQWIFWKMYEQGLAYQDSRMQWWCTKCQTVLANEQVIDGKCWRHDGADDPIVEKKEVKQWFFKITDYADELLEAINGLDWTDTVKLAQKNWIGKSTGAEVTFDLDMPPQTNFVILHGYTGRNDKNFIPWLKQTLESRGFRVQAPQLPNTDNPVESEQVSYVQEHCTFDENTVLIGHSLGGAVAMKVVEKLPIAIRKLVLAAPVVEPAFRGEDYHAKKRRTFVDTFDLSYDYNLIRSKAKSCVVLSENAEARERRPYLEYLAAKLQAPLLEADGRGIHFTGDSEPLILEAAAAPKVTVFTTRPDTLYGATFMVLAPEHPLLDEIVPGDKRQAVDAYREAALKKTELERQENKEKTGEFTGAYAINPASGAKIPIWVADYVLYGYGTGAIMAVPAHDERDNEFARKFDLPIVRVVQSEAPNDECSHDEGVMMNSGEFDGQASSDARENIVKMLEKQGKAAEKVNYKMRDWSVSRQRYWGAPIPIVNCPKDGAVLVPEDQLPIILPELDDFQPAGDGRSALARATDWLETDCPKCGGPAERETDTLDTYICSSWYMYRYFDPHNQQQIFDSNIVKKWEPIDFYNGADHATAHLLYARFIGHFFKRLGMINEPEPFKQFLFNGKVTAQDGTMFSKSKGNGVDPLEIIGQGYGADALRTYLMFAAPLDMWIRWDPQGVPGTYRFLNRVWTLVQEYLETRDKGQESRGGGKKDDVLRTTHAMVKKMTEDIEENRYNTAIAAAMTAVNELYKLKVDGFVPSSAWQEALERVVACIAPFAPHIADELWLQLGHHTSVHRDSWPKWDERYLLQDTVTIAVQINGKLRGTIDVPAGANEADTIAAAQADKKISGYLGGKNVVKTIYVPKKLVSFVLK